MLLHDGPLDGIEHASPFARAVPLNLQEGVIGDSGADSVGRLAADRIAKVECLERRYATRVEPVGAGRFD